MYRTERHSADPEDRRPYRPDPDPGPQPFSEDYDRDIVLEEEGGDEPFVRKTPAAFKIFKPPAIICKD